MARALTAGGSALVLALIGSSSGAQEASDPDQDEELRALRREVDELAREVADLRDTPLAGYDGGFFVRSADGRLVFTLEGLLQVRGTFFEGGLDDRTSEFDLERMRFELGGALDDSYRFHVEPNFTESEVELEEAWVGVTPPERSMRILLGRMKEPFSLEEMLPRRHFDFPTFSILNQFVPAEDHGITVLGGSLDSAVEWGAALYNGTGGDDLNDDKDVAGRWVWRPWAAREGSRLARLQIGAAATLGEADEDVSGEELLTEAKVPFASFAPGSSLDGERVRLGAEAAWLRGSFGIFGEAIRVEQEMRGALGETDADLEGGYLALSWVASGEDESFRGVRPARPFAFGNPPGSGALQLAARVSQLELDDALETFGLLSPGTSPGSVTTYDVGLNWLATEHFKVMLHALFTEYEEAIVLGGESRDSESAVLVQFQVQF